MWEFSNHEFIGTKKFFKQKLYSKNKQILIEYNLFTFIRNTKTRKQNCLPYMRWQLTYLWILEAILKPIYFHKTAGECSSWRKRNISYEMLLSLSLSATSCKCFRWKMKTAFDRISFHREKFLVIVTETLKDSKESFIPFWQILPA